MGAVIKVRGNGKRGTVFCVRRQNALRFITAAHVLTDCGIPANADQGILEMCDDATEFLNGPKVYQIANIYRNPCDYAEFDCVFPGQPFNENPALAVLNARFRIEGYQQMPDGTPPDCGVITTVDGDVIGLRPCGEDGIRTVLVLQLPRQHYDGASGAPILFRSGDSDYAAAVFIGLWGDNIGFAGVKM